MRRPSAAALAIGYDRNGFATAFVAFLWVNAALVACAAAWRATIPLALCLPSAFGLVAVPTLLWRLREDDPDVPVVCSIALAGLVALLVAIFRATGSGPVLQIDVHMYFFACLAVCMGWLDWRSIAAFTAVTIIHHLIMAAKLPMAVFPDGGGFPRAVLHGGILALEAVVLVWTIQQVRKAVAATETALSLARSAGQEADQLRRETEARSIVDVRWRQDAQARIEALRLSLVRLGGDVSAELERMQRTATALSGVAADTIDQASRADDAARDAAETVGQVADSTAALAASVSEISLKVHQTGTVTRNATATARDMNQRVEALAEAAGRIADVVRIIESVAAQTNLLALNATIEAARAGAAGRGFAVVAQEVKALAAETARSTADITSLVASIRAVAGGAVAAVGVIEEVTHTIDRSTLTIAASVEEQEAATREIGHSTEIVRRSTEVVAAAIGNVTGAAAATSAAAFELEDATGTLSGVIHELTTTLDDFLSGILAERRAA